MQPLGVLTLSLAAGRLAPHRSALSRLGAVKRSPNVIASFTVDLPSAEVAAEKGISKWPAMSYKAQQFTESCEPGEKRYVLDGRAELVAISSEGSESRRTCLLPGALVEITEPCDLVWSNLPGTSELLIMAPDYEAPELMFAMMGTSAVALASVAFMIYSTTSPAIASGP